MSLGKRQHLLSLLLSVVLIRLMFQVLRIVSLRFVSIIKSKGNGADSTHRKEEPERGAGLTTCPLDDRRGDERSNEARGLSDSVEEGKEYKSLRSRNHFRYHGHRVRSPGGSLEVPRRLRSAAIITSKVNREGFIDSKYYYILAFRWLAIPNWIACVAAKCALICFSSMSSCLFWSEAVYVPAIRNGKSSKRGDNVVVRSARPLRSNIVHTIAVASSSTGTWILCFRQ